MGAKRLILVAAGASVMGLGLMSAVVVQGSGQAMAAPGTPAAGAGHARPAQEIGVTVTKTADPDPYIPGERLTFTVTVGTVCVGSCPVGGPAVIGVIVSDPLPAQLSSAGFTWTCAASAGGSCAASGTGGIHDSARIAGTGGHLTYNVKGTVPASARGLLVDG